MQVVVSMNRQRLDTYVFKRRQMGLALVAGMLFVDAGAVLADQQVLVAGAAADGYTLMIGDKKQWDTVVNSDSISSAAGFLSVEPDVENGAIKATWSGKGEAQLFLAHNTEPQDFTKLVEQDAALVMLIQVYAPPKRKPVALKMGCVYPCGADTDLRKLLNVLPTEQWVKVSVDLRCFAKHGLNVEQVDSPLTLLTKSKLSLSIADVRVVPGAGETATIRCR